jgi:HK97 family phage prohead protease
MATPTAERVRPTARPPREDVQRQAPFRLRAADDAADGEPNDGLTLDGWGAVFNRETIIDSWEGRFREAIKPGSMKKSFRENPPKIQFDHGRHPLIGSIPIASLRSIAEETDPTYAPEGGAHVIGRVHDNWLMEPVRDAIAEGDIDGMSFRFSVVREAWFDAEGKQVKDEDELWELLMRTWYEDVPDEELLLRELRELRVPEIGPVVWPAYVDTSVGMRSRVIDLNRLTDPGQRKLLAKAVLLADAAERSETEHQQTGDAPDDTREPTGTPAADHAATGNDTPRSTDTGQSGSAGEHASVPLQRGQRPIDRWVAKGRDVLISIDAKEKSR